MRIKTINIFGFGKWHDQTIDLQTDYQVLYGQNEVGKSTITAFIKGVLFGFATGKQKYEQYLPKSGAQYGGELIVDHHDREITIRRVAW
ncbi:AAA family ATPase [Latilactobacillus sakei]